MFVDAYTIVINDQISEDVCNKM